MLFGRYVNVVILWGWYGKRNVCLLVGPLLSIVVVNDTRGKKTTHLIFVRYLRSRNKVVRATKPSCIKE